MSTEAAAGTFDPNSIRKVITVNASQAIAWRVFTAGMSSWWPLAHYKIGRANAVAAVVEPFTGGRWYEKGDDGSTCDWGKVLAWEPTSRLLLTWDINADWKYDPQLGTELEIRFVAESETRTRVELEHRRLDRYGARRDEMRNVFDKSGDWGRLLAQFAEVAADERSRSPA
ncbi:MAG TPA: SRPBCC family protein [Polyangiaceae bacterium]|nr:SRPBCC family protein [Polyangiaceae bacterium]